MSTAPETGLPPPRPQPTRHGGSAASNGMKAALNIIYATLKRHISPEEPPATKASPRADHDRAVTSDPRNSWTADGFFGEEETDQSDNLPSLPPAAR